MSEPTFDEAYTSMAAFAHRYRKWLAEQAERDRKADAHDGLLGACELALESEECVCGGNKAAPCMHCILTAAVKAATP